jgi:hypothetical protein
LQAAAPTKPSRAATLTGFCPCFLSPFLTQTHHCYATDEALSSAAQKLRGLIDVLPELPDEVQGALAMRVPGLLDLEPQEVRVRLQTLAEILGLELEPTARLVGKVRGLAAAGLVMLWIEIECHHIAAAALHTAVPCSQRFCKTGHQQQQHVMSLSLSNTHEMTLSRHLCCALQVPLLWNRSLEAAAVAVVACNYWRF